MENVITVKNMRESDAFTINTTTSSRELMYRAAMGVFKNVSWGGKIAIVCGSGNNGGDGYALAEILSERGYRPIIMLASDKRSEDGEHYYTRCLKDGVRSESCDGSTDFNGFDIVVDCLLGTGFSGQLREPMLSIIKAINRSSAYTVSVDINSGLSGSNGLAQPVAVKSDLTVSIGYYKTGMFLGDSCQYIGSLVNADIGIKLVKKQFYLISGDELSPFTGYSSVQLTAPQFALEYATDEAEFWRSPIKIISQESCNSKKIFVVDFGGSRLVVDQTYVYFQSDRVIAASEEYVNF